MPVTLTAGQIVGNVSIPALAVGGAFETFDVDTDIAAVSSETHALYEFELGGGVVRQWDLSGTGFTYNGEGELASGTITGWTETIASGEYSEYRDAAFAGSRTFFNDLINGGVRFDLTGLNIAVPDFLSWAFEGDGTTDLFTQVFNGNDVLSGNSLSTEIVIEPTGPITIAVPGFPFTIGDQLRGYGGNDTLNGNGGDDHLFGDSGKDTLNGGDGNDLLDGGTGNDKMSGGAGSDFYVVDSASDVVKELANGGMDIVESSSTYTLPANVEVLYLTGLGSKIGVGNNLDNTIDGSNEGENVLKGGMGNDTLIGGIVLDDMLFGGLGNDTYLPFSGDTVTEQVNAGTHDKVLALFNYTLGANLEDLSLLGEDAIDGTGNGARNIIEGNSGSNVLRGLGGIDRLRGLGGDDTLGWDAADSEVDGGTGEDTLRIEARNGTIDLRAINNSVIDGVEIISLDGKGDNTLRLASSDVLAISSETNTLRVDGDEGDRVLAANASSWTPGDEDVEIEGSFYHVYTRDGATLLIDVDITTNLPAIM